MYNTKFVSFCEILQVKFHGLFYYEVQMTEMKESGNSKPKQNYWNNFFFEKQNFVSKNSHRSYNLISDLNVFPRKNDIHHSRCQRRQHLAMPMKFLKIVFLFLLIRLPIEDFFSNLISPNSATLLLTHLCYWNLDKLSLFYLGIKRKNL